MKKLVLLLLVAFGTTAFAENYVVMNENYIEVTAKAEKEVVPDEIYLRIVLNEGNYKNRKLSELEKDLAAVLKKSGVDVEKSLKIKDLSSNFTKRFLSRKANVEQEYSLLLHDMKTLMQVIKNMDAAGFSDFGIERVDNSKMEAYRSEVRIEAMKKAAKKASELAQAIGQDAGKAVYIRESDMNYYAPRNVMYAMKSCDMVEEDAAMPELEFEPLKLNSSVTVRFEFK